MIRPSIPPNQLSGKLSRAKADSEKANAQASKLFNRFMENPSDDKIMEHWLRAYDRAMDLSEEESSLVLMVEAWKIILAAEQAELDCEAEEMKSKLKGLDAKRERIALQLRTMFFG